MPGQDVFFEVISREVGGFRRLLIGLVTIGYLL